MRGTRPCPGAPRSLDGFARPRGRARQVGDDHRCPLAREAQRAGAADPARGAGDQTGFALHWAAHCVNLIRRDGDRRPPDPDAGTGWAIAGGGRGAGRCRCRSSPIRLRPRRSSERVSEPRISARGPAAGRQPAAPSAERDAAAELSAALTATRAAHSSMPTRVSSTTSSPTIAQSRFGSKAGQ